jgi:hypothetical protein
MEGQSQHSRRRLRSGRRASDGAQAVGQARRRAEAQTLTGLSAARCQRCLSDPLCANCAMPKMQNFWSRLASIIRAAIADDVPSIKLIGALMHEASVDMTQGPADAKLASVSKSVVAGRHR